MVIGLLSAQLKFNLSETETKQFQNCFVSAKTKHPAVKRFSCLSAGTITYAWRRRSQRWIVVL